jgi:hypothetical protein
MYFGRKITLDEFPLDVSFWRYPFVRLDKFILGPHVVGGENSVRSSRPVLKVSNI